MAYHTKLDLDIYHTCRNCSVGNNIDKANLREGKPGAAKLCKVCKDLQAEGNCKPGTPTPAR